MKFLAVIICLVSFAVAQQPQQIPKGEPGTLQPGLTAEQVIAFADALKDESSNTSAETIRACTLIKNMVKQLQTGDKQLAEMDAKIKELERELADMKAKKGEKK
jgi:uncharacterized protein YlxW (UPF0749 family)